MKNVTRLLRENPLVSDYKINILQKESWELFFVKGEAETLRRTDTCDREVTVYADHEGFRGEAQFRIYPFTTEEQLRQEIQTAAEKALLMENRTFSLPEKEEGCYEVESNFTEYDPVELAQRIAKTVFAANDIENASLNSVEVFVQKLTQTVENSRGLKKTQVRYAAEVELIPTYNGEKESVELYEMLYFNRFDEASLGRDVKRQLSMAKARYEAVHPDFPLDFPVIFNKPEVLEFLWCIVDQLNYEAVYSRSGVFEKGDLIQKDAAGDLITITMAGQAPGSVSSRWFDGDGLSLGSVRLVENGRVLNYYGVNRYGQYLGENPTGDLRCLCAQAGSTPEEAFSQGPHLEILSMSGLQVDFYNDYIGGEVRLALYHDGEKEIPLTGISLSGSIGEVLRDIRLSKTVGTSGSYTGPEKALIKNMKVF